MWAVKANMITRHKDDYFYADILNAWNLGYVLERVINYMHLKQTVVFSNTAPWKDSPISEISETFSERQNVTTTYQKPTKRRNNHKCPHRQFKWFIDCLYSAFSSRLSIQSPSVHPWMSHSPIFTTDGTALEAFLGYVSCPRALWHIDSGTLNQALDF